MLLTRRSVLLGAAALLASARPGSSASRTALLSPGLELPADEVIVGVVPRQLGWDEQRWPVMPLLHRHGDKWTGRLDAGSFDPAQHPAYAACLASAPIYCAPDGDDAHGDGSALRPVRSIWKAQRIANATRRPARIVVAAGLYDGSQNFSAGRGGNGATVDTMYVAAGGRAVVTTHDAALSWAPDLALPGCFVAHGLKAVPARVVDVATATDGLHADLVPVATAEELVVTPMSYLVAATPTATGWMRAGSAEVDVDGDVRARGWTIGDAVLGPAMLPGAAIAAIAPDGLRLTLTTAATKTVDGIISIAPALRVNRGGESPSQATTRVYGTAGNFLPPQAYRSVIMVGAEDGSGFDLEGGALPEATGAALLFSLTEKGDGSALVYARDCTFRYAGARQLRHAANGVQVNNFSGLALFEGCDASANKSDGFNYHDSRGYGVQGLLVNCTASDNGLPGSTSNNGMTSHEGCRVIALGGELRRNAGCSWHAINQSRALLMGVVSGESRGDVIFGGSLKPCEIAASDEAIVFAWSVAAYPQGGEALAFSAGGRAVIHKRSCAGVAALEGGGRVDEYPANSTAWEPSVDFAQRSSAGTLG